MALTRPNFNNIQTNVSVLSDALTVLHGGSSIANADVGFIMNRANGLVSNVAIYWNEAGNTFVTAFTSNSGATDSNVLVSSYANLTTGGINAIGINATGNVTAANLITTGTYGNITGANVISANSGTYTSNVSALGFVGTHYGNVVGTTGSNIYVTGHMIPTANVAYDLGSSSQRWRTLYISGNTIVMGGGTISMGPTGSFTFGYATGAIADGIFANLTANSGIAATSTTTGAFQVIGGTGISGDVYIGGNIVQTGTGYLTIPTGTTAQRPVSPASGMVRYNSTLSSFEGYGSAWSSLGGVKSVDGNTYILAEATVGAGDNTLWFYNNATNTAKLTTSNLTLLQTTPSTSTTTGALIVTGGAGIGGNLYVGGNLTVLGNITTQNYETITNTEFANAISATGNISTTANLVVGGTGTFSANVSIGGATPGLITPPGSNSNLIIDPDGSGNVYISANTFINYYSPSTSTTTGALIVAGGVGVAGDTYVGGNVAVVNRSYVKFIPSGSSNWVGLRAPSSVSANVIFNLPGSDGTSGQFLKTDGAGNWSFASGGGGGGGASGFQVSTITTHPAAAGNKSLGTGSDNVTEETPFASGGTDAFGVSLGIVYDQMEPTGTLVSVDMGSAGSI